MAAAEGKTSKRVWLTLLAAALATCGVAGGGLLWGASRVTTLLTEPTWTSDAVARSDLGRVFGVRLPDSPLQYSSRNSGFQDPYLEALLLLPPGGEARFLEVNGLTAAGTPAQDTAEAEDQVLSLAPDTGAIEAVGLEGLHPLQGADGGFVALFRHGALLRAGGATWVYLVAFGS
jgi:hypothetical protein